MSDGAAAPAGWYPDPQGQPVLRWWDGVRWNEQTQAAAQAYAPAQPQPYWPGYAAAAPRSGNGYSTTGIVLGSIAFLFLPILLGPAGLILGGIGKSKGESRATAALVVSGLGTVVGMIFSVIVYLALHPAR